MARAATVLRQATLAVFVMASWSLPGQAPAHEQASSLVDPQVLFRHGDFRSAAARYREQIAQKPSPEAYSGLIQSLLKLDDVAAGEEESRRGLELFPQSAAAHVARGDVIFRRGLLAEARVEYESARKLDEKCARAWLGVGKEFLAAARQDQARLAFARAHDLDPDDGDILYNWATLLPYPQNVSQLDKHLAEYRSDLDQERREHDFVELIRHLAGKKVWVPAREGEQAEIKLETVALGPGMVLGAGLRVRFNDSVTSTLLLDTGANWITIPRKLAEKIGAKKISDYGIEGTGDSGPAAGYFAWVDKIVIGDLEFQDCLVHVSMKNDMGGIDGVVGPSFLAGHLVTLDFPAHRLRLSPLPKPETRAPSAHVPSELLKERAFFSFGHFVLLPAELNGFATGLFVLDTGANTTSVTPDLAGRVGKLRDATPRVTGLSGEVKKVFVLDGATFRFSPATQSLDKVAAFDRHSLSKELGTEISGFIGYDLLQKMKVIINYRDGVVEFEGK